MTVLEKLRGGNENRCPDDVKKAVKRGREHAERELPYRRECIAFANGDQYVYVAHKAKELRRQATAPGGRDGKPAHRVRLTNNLIRPILKAKVSAATQRVPSYEVLPNTVDAEAISAASLSERVALAGFERWGIRRAMKRLVWNALVADAGFVMAYWDSLVGPRYGLDGQTVAEGDVRIGVYSATEVYWEPGVEFEHSRWYAIEHARPLDVLEKDGAFVGGSLKSDADAHPAKSSKVQSDNLVMVTEFFERPSAEHPAGRHLTIANDRVIFKPGDYPCMDQRGEVQDRPCLHPLYYDLDPDSEVPMSLVRSLIDPQRSHNLANNKAHEWIIQALNPQILAYEGSIITPPTDEPGSIVYHRTMPGGFEPKWREVPAVPAELFGMQDRTQALMGHLSHSNDIPSQVESGKGILALIEADRMAWADLPADLAAVHGALMADCLTLVQRNYTEDRLLRHRGRGGWEAIRDFRGAQIAGQTDVRVSAASVEPRTREAIERQIMQYAQLGWVSPDAAMSAVHEGTAEKLIDGFELDKRRAHTIIEKCRAGVLLDEPPRPVFPGEEYPNPAFDPNEPPGPENSATLVEVPGWMPRPNIDHVAIHKQVVGDWLKTDDFDRLDPPSKMAAMSYFQALLDLEAQEASRQAALQAEQAEQMGMANASRPQPGKPMPSQPGPQGPEQGPPPA